MSNTPVRMCVICRKRFPKNALARYVQDQEGNLLFDADKTSPGRGWYVCSQEECRAKLLKYRPKRRTRGKI